MPGCDTVLDRSKSATSCSIPREHTPRVRGKAIRGAEARADIVSVELI
jgi:hypothetical protein